MDTSMMNRADLRLLEAVGVTTLTPRRKEFKLFTILLNETRPQISSSKSTSSDAVPDRIVTDDMISKLGKLLKLKIQSHSCDNVDMFTADEVIKNNMPTLVSVMFRLAAEDFVRSSKTTFKIIECRNSTKLSTDWKPSLVDIILELGHQVIIVELCDFPHYTDFSYAILRQLRYEWKVKLPRSIFYPDDVCTVEHSNDQQVIIVSPKMPDDDIIDLASRIQDNLKYEIIRMMQSSCANGLRNHLLKRDLRVGNFSDTEIGLQAICHVYRALQRKLKEEGTNIQMGKYSEDVHQLLTTLAGDSLIAAGAFLEYCKNPRPGLTPRKEKRKISTAESSHHHEDEETGSGDSNGTTPRAVETHNEDENNKEDSEAIPSKQESNTEDPVLEKDTLDEILNAIQNLRPAQTPRQGQSVGMKASQKDLSWGQDQVAQYKTSQQSQQQGQ